MGSAIEAFDQGVQHVQNDELQLAVEAFSQAIAQNPELAIAYHGRGIARAIWGDLDQALNDCDLAIHLNPKAAKFYHARALVFRELGDEARAQADLRTYRDLNGDVG
jgi:tetratricopeptide (TPR) repeat protein